MDEVSERVNAWVGVRVGERAGERAGEWVGRRLGNPKRRDGIPSGGRRKGGGAWCEDWLMCDRLGMRGAERKGAKTGFCSSLLSTRLNVVEDAFHVGDKSGKPKEKA